MFHSKRSKKEIVSYKMSQVRAKNTGIEKRLASILRKHGLRGYRRNVRGVLGTPDFCWEGKKIAIFCDSSFWHGYDWKNQIKTIKTRKKFWVNKIETNIDRDKRINRKLRKEGWKVLRFWDFVINKDVDKCAAKVKGALESA
jgi:DNA mismatch endonuclease (patch repair protein)